MPTELKQLLRQFIGGESIVLAFSAPFLLFPTVFWPGTLVVLLLLAGSWLAPMWTTRRSGLPHSPFNLALLLFSLTLLMGILVTADPDLTLPKTTGLILGLALWRYSLRQASQLVGTSWGTLFFLLLAVGFTLIGVLSTNWLYKIPFIASILARLPQQLVSLPEAPEVGTHSNQLAATVDLYFPLLLSLLGGRVWSRRGRWLLGGTTAVTLFILILTQSRSGWLAAAGGAFTLLLLWGQVLPPGKTRQRLRRLALALVVIGLGMVLWLGPQVLQSWWLDPPTETAVGSLQSINFRQEIWPWALTAVNDFPFTGMGLGTFRRAGPRLYPFNAPPDYDIAHAHNIFLQTALDIGLPGLVVYGALLFLAGVTGWQVAWHHEQQRPLALGLLAGLVALHIYGLTDALALGAKPALLFWATLGLLAALFEQHTKDPAQLAKQ